MSLLSKWVSRTVPAILAYAEEIGMMPPDNDQPNSKCRSPVLVKSNIYMCILMLFKCFFLTALTMYCLRFLVENLKMKGFKVTPQERLSAIVIFAPVCQSKCTCILHCRTKTLYFTLNFRLQRKVSRRLPKILTRTFSALELLNVFPPVLLCVTTKSSQNIFLSNCCHVSYSHGHILQF